MESPQLPIYKHYYEATRENCVVDALKYVFIPKINIRQGKNETLQEFRVRLNEHLEAAEIKIVTIPDSNDSVTQFQNSCKLLESVEKFPKNPSRLCDWCNYQQYCESNEEIDYMIIKED